jgi:hypothetical protein
MKNSFFSFLIISISFLLGACKPDEVDLSKGFIKYFGGIDMDDASDVQQTSDGGYIIIGSTQSIGKGGTDMYVVKTDSRGNEIWSKTFGDSLNDLGSGVKQTSDGGYFFIGTYRYISGPDSNKTDMYLIRANSNGDTIWTKKYGNFSGISTNEEGISIDETNDGGYIIAGNTDVASDGDLLVVKINSLGIVEQNAQHPASNAAGLDQSINILQRNDGGYVLSSYSAGLNSPRPIFINPIISGAPSAPAKDGFFEASMHTAGEVTTTTDGEFVLTGKTLAEDIFVIKFKNSLSNFKVWYKTFGGSGFDAGSSIQATNDGGYVVLGSTNSFGAGSRDIYLFKIDGSGTNVEWSKTFGGAGFDVGKVVRKTSDGGYIILGTLEFGDDPSNKDNIFCLIKVNEKGEVGN